MSASDRGAARTVWCRLLEPAAGGFCGVRSTGAYDFMGSFAFVETNDLFENGSATLNVYDVSKSRDYSTIASCAIAMNTGTLAFVVRNEGDEQTLSTVVDYSPTQHRWWRIEQHAPQGCAFFTSPSGEPGSWTLRQTSDIISASFSFAPSSVAVGVSAFAPTDSTPGVAEFDNLNTIPN